VSAASLLDISEDTDKKGKKYYKYELLVRSGEEAKLGTSWF
jgi:photosystem II oxygen-evolving enhancer protein 2/Niemann-Pick C1 protein